MSGPPAAEVAVDAALARALLKAQHPDLAELPISPLAEGWDNVMFRLGEGLVMRLPRRKVAAELIAHEQDWLPVLAPRLPLPTPAPVRAGGPGCGYPWRWSVVPWLEGEPADCVAPKAAAAPQLAAFLKALHLPAPADAPANPVRGVALAAREETVSQRLIRLGAGGHIAARIDAAWHAALAAPAATERLWLHGDLHGGNVLVRDGLLSGVIDWGDITAGDPATDLAAVWTLLAAKAHRRACLAAYGASPELTARAAGWAILFGSILLETGLAGNPRHAKAGAAILARVAADAVSAA